jgi:hypothetical protein
MNKVSRILLNAAVLITAVIVATPSFANATSIRALSLTASAAKVVTVSWTRPDDATSDSDYSYTVNYRANSSGDYSKKQVSPGVTNTIITNLTGGTTYEFVVSTTPTRGAKIGDEFCSVSGTCTNLAGSSSGSITAQDVPSAPSIGTATAGDRQVQVAFSAGGLNGSTLSNYTATCGTISASDSASPLTVSGLTNGYSYTCTVKATSNQGDSASSAVTSAVTPSTTPDVMNAPTVVAGNAQVSLSWTAVVATTGAGVDAAVVDDGGSAITGYQIQILNSAGTVVTTSDVASSATSTTITSLIQNDVPYTAKIRALNSNGSGSYSVASSSFTPSEAGGTSDPILTIVSQPGAIVSGSTFGSSNRPVIGNLGGAGVIVSVRVNSGVATLSGTTTATSVSGGTATFSNLTISSASTVSVSLIFSATGFQSITSSSFSVTNTTSGGGGGDDGGGGGGDDGGGDESSETTIPAKPKTTTTTTPKAPQPVTSTPNQNSGVAVKTPANAGKAVQIATQPAKGVADGVAIATKPSTLTFVVDAPAPTKTTTIARYKVQLKLEGSNKTITRTILVKSSNTPIVLSFSKLKGKYQLTLTAINTKGKTVGNWRSSSITISK